MFIAPITFKAASEFVGMFHRHNKPPTGCKFCICVKNDQNEIEGVAQCGRPIARYFDDGLTLEINRTCTTGKKNANSMLYGACRKIAKAMGYKRIITYTQSDETGISLHAAGFIKVKNLPVRKNWEESSVKYKGNRQKNYCGGVARVLWEVRFK